MNKKLILPFIILSLTVLGLTTCVKEPKPLPQAEFTYTTSAACEMPMSVSFENLSMNATVYRWDFGDGSPVLHAQNPIHVYSTEGVYEVTLTSYGEGGMHETKNFVYVVSAPVASFYAGDTLADVGDSIQFFSSIHSSLPTTCLWSFGDGFTSPLENPTHAYSYPGTYTVVLTVTNACGSTYVILNDYIVISQAGMAPTPDFYASQTSVNTGTPINFFDVSSNNPQSWEWTFNGATPATSTLQHPTNVIYSNPGVYDVTLKVSNSNGDSTLTKTAYINVIPSGTAPVANFTANITTIQTGGSISFTDLSLNNPTSWQWQFQGGTPATSTAQNPTNIVYTTAGTYSVSLTASNAQGSHTETKQAYITVNPQFVTQVSITKITVENMPFGMPPMPRNPYYKITNANDNILRNGRDEALYGITQYNLPISWILSPYYAVPNMNMFLRVHIFDRKSTVQQDIPLGYVQFRPSDYTGQPNPYPPSITLQQNNVKIIIDLLWQ